MRRIPILISTLVITLVVTLVYGNSVVNADQGRAIEFLIEDNGTTLPQTALVQDGKVSVKQIGGDVNQDILFVAGSQTLFIIDHQAKSYYKIDQNVINKVASMVDSLSAVAGAQQGVVSDLLETLGLANEEGEVNIQIVETNKTLSAANIDCKLFQEYRNGRLESELCLAEKNSLGGLGEAYSTLDSLYQFGNQLLNRAGSILSNMGMLIPKLTKLEKEGLPILLYMANEKIKTSLIRITNQTSAPENFLIPAGYTQTPIPFIG